jgi:hypothetical protein
MVELLLVSLTPVCDTRGEESITVWPAHILELTKLFLLHNTPTKFCKTKYQKHYKSLRFSTLKIVQIKNNVGNMTLYETTQDVKLDFGFGQKRRKNSISTKFSAQKLKFVSDIQHCNIHEFQITHEPQRISCS